MPAVRVEPVFDDPAAIRDLVRGAGPFRPLALEAASDAERRASGAVAGGEFVPPWFRRNLATHGEVHVAGGERLLHHHRFIEAARAVFPGGDVVVPTTVYVNVMGPAPYPFIPHRDVPVFRGVDRANCPVWLLHRMLASGRFEKWRVDLATAVTWFYEGEGGSFHYWPDGPDAAPHIEAAPFANVAVVADNERTFHGVAEIPAPDSSSPTDLTLEARMDRDAVAGTWSITEDEATRATYADPDVRITISWKAEVFAGEAERDRRRAPTEGLTVERVLATMTDALAEGGLPAPDADDPLHDDQFMANLAQAFPDSAPVLS